MSARFQLAGSSRLRQLLHVQNVFGVAWWLFSPHSGCSDSIRHRVMLAVFHLPVPNMVVTVDGMGQMTVKQAMAAEHWIAVRPATMATRHCVRRNPFLSPLKRSGT